MERGADADIFVLLHDGKQLSEDRAAGIVADADDPRTRCPEGSELLIAPIRLAVEVQAKLIEKRQKLKAAPAQLFNERRVALTSAGSLCILYESSVESCGFSGILKPCTYGDDPAPGRRIVILRPGSAFSTSYAAVSPARPPPIISRSVFTAYLVSQIPPFAMEPTFCTKRLR